MTNGVLVGDEANQQHVEGAVCSCPSCSGTGSDGTLDASLDPLAGGTFNNKPIWTADQIAAWLNRGDSRGPNPSYNVGPGNALQKGDADPSTITFGFFTSLSEMASNGYVYQSPTDGEYYSLAEYSNFAPFSEAQMAAARESMLYWDDVVAISFREVSADNADITFANLASAPTTQAYSRLPYDSVFTNAAVNDQSKWISGDVWISASQLSNFRLDEGGYGLQTLTHEVGHSIGLSHPGAYNASPGVSITYGPNAEYAQDTRAYTIMSYFEASEISGTRHFDFHISTTAYSGVPLIHDIAAAQRIYGADMTTRTGDTVYGFNSNAGRDVFDFTLTPAPIAAIWDAGGIDTIDTSGYATDQLIDLTPGSLSSIGGVTYDTAPSYEQVNANRAAAGFPEIDPVTGALAAGTGVYLLRSTYDGNMAALRSNSAIGRLTDNFGIAYGVTIENAIGGSGNDTIVGNAAANVLDGRGGIDIASYRNSNEGVNVSLATGVASGGHAAGDTLINIEGLEGSAFADVLTGDDGANILIGGAGADILDGGEGFDTASFRNSAAAVTVRVSDTGVITVSGDGVGDVYNSIEAVEGSNFADSMTGGALGDTLFGFGGNDVIDGRGGDDRLSGGDGNDVLIGGAGADILDGGAGTDTASYRTSAAAVTVMVSDTGVVSVSGDGEGDTYNSIEIIEGSTFGDLMIGGALADALNGGDGDDQIFGAGGNDNLSGGAGLDTLDGGTGNDILDGGAGNDVLRGGANDDILIGGAGADVLDGGDGFDIASYRTAAAGVTVTISNTGAISVTGDGVGDSYISIEAVEGSAFADTMNGGALADWLIGGAGNDVINGGAGADRMVGGTGNDTYDVDDAGDVVTELANEGTDLVRSTINYTLGANVENLTLFGTAVSGTGNELANTITGNALANILSGGAGNDVLDGGLGNDTMIGGLGNDIMVVRDAGDIVIEAANEGTDQVTSFIDYTLVANVENLVLQSGSVAVRGTGNELGNIIQGNANANILSGLEGNDDLRGLDGNDTLDGGAGNDRLDGGNGDDIMVGGTGNDTYIVGQAGDVVIELEDEGTDVVQSSISYALGNNVENLTLTGSAAINGTGNALGNVINGNGAANTLNGGDGDDVLFGGGGNDQLIGGAGNDLLDGGVGSDHMAGGTGDDIYVVTEVGDVVVELEGEGIDLVRSGLSYTLGANVENLQLIGVAQRGTGNGLANAIMGTQGANLLEGMDGNDTLSGLAGDDTLDGGTGSDQMFGGTGNDLYYVDDAGDVVTELEGEGTDTVSSSIDYALTSHVENLTLTGTARSGTGNGLDNVIIGNAHDNVLNGGGGNDRLEGGAGNDTLNGGVGADRMLGGTGNDFYFVDNSGDMVVELAGEGIDTVSSSIDYALGSNVENLILTGTARDGTGNGLNNILVGNAQGNRLNGGAGDDRLIGGDGVDWLTGGAGRDVFVAEINATKSVGRTGPISVDLILDFARGEDKIDLSGIDANSNRSGHQMFSWVGHAAGNNAGDLSMQTFGNMNAAEAALGMDLDGIDGDSIFEGPVTVLFGNVDGGAKDFAMVFVGTHSLSSSDFIFAPSGGAMGAGDLMAASNSNSPFAPVETQYMFA